MTHPKMILFDYGDTLICEPDFDTLRGEKALMDYVVANKHHLSAEEINDFAQELFARTGSARQNGWELHEWQFQKLLYEYLEITLGISLPEAERIFWDNASAGAVMPGAEKMLDYIKAKGIRSGVISNISFSGQALTERINRLLPNNQFEFIIASSEYLFRKPAPILFELALKKAGLQSGEVWFCGDNITADIEGSANAGLFPVWYEELSVENPWIDKNIGKTPRCAHLHIHSWDELIVELERGGPGKI